MRLTAVNAVLLFVIGLFIAGLAIAAGGIVYEMGARRAEYKDSILWFSTQVEREAAAFDHVADMYFGGAEDVTRDALQNRFDVFWSRVDSARLGRTGKEYLALTGAAAALRNASFVIRELEPLVLTAERADSTARRTIRSRMEPVMEELHVVSLRALQASNLLQERNRNRFIGFAWVVLTIFAGVLLSGGLLVAMLIREKSKADRLRDGFEIRVKERTAELEQEVEDHQRTENALKESEERLRDFASSTADWFWEMDENLRYTYFSLKTDDKIRVSPELFIGKRRGEFLGDDYDREKWADHSRVLDAREPYRNFVFHRVLEGADPIWIKSSGVPVFNDHGKFLGYRGSGTDITEEVHREAQLLQSQKMEALGRLTGGVAHDFNNLLAVILGSADLLQGKLADTEGRQRRQLGAIVRAAERGAELTGRLLAFSRTQELKTKATRLDRLTEDMIDLLRRSLGENIEVQTIHDADLWHCLADPGQVENALLNMAINARDAMPGGGRLSIETRNSQIDDAYAAEQVDLAPGDYVTLAVSDTGTGMTPAVQERIFDPFFTTKKIGEGTGLGLSMVFGMVKQSGGHVTIQSGVGQGSVLTLYLPRAADAEDLEWTKDENSDREARGEVVFVVEDNGEVRDVAVTLLEEAGYRVLQADCGPAAIAQLDSAPDIDLLLTDVVLAGGMNGRDVAAELGRRRSDLKVLYMSGQLDKALAHEDWPDDGVELLCKPFRRSELESKVRSVLDGKPTPKIQPAAVGEEQFEIT